MNVRNPFVNPLKVLLLSLSIKLGLMKQFVKGLNRESNSFRYEQELFTCIMNAN